MIPEQCSFSVKGSKCLLPPDFIIEINDDGIDENNKFMVGLTCSEHKHLLEEKFLTLQKRDVIPQGKIVFTNIRMIHTNCIKGTDEDMDEIKLKRI